MNRIEVQQALQTLISYFETGNQETDAAAKAIVASDADNRQEAIERFRNSTEWTGIRAPEAEMLALALREASEVYEARSDRLIR
jgi:hypothetical protein